jgi:subtilisin-like proprotein convertase family protein
MLTRLVKNEDGKYEHTNMPFYKVIPVGQSGYATWIRQYGNGYMMGGSAINGDNKFDLFLQKIDADYDTIWTKYYGWKDSDEFADALLTTDHVYIAGSAGVLVPGTTNYRDQIYVVKTDTDGVVDWEVTYGGTNRHYANKIMMTGEGDLLVAGTAYDASMHTHMFLMKIDAEKGDSLWTQSYAESFTYAGIRDAIRTDDFGYLVAGRGSYSASQEPRVYMMKLDHGDEKEHLQIPRTDLSIPINPSATATDAISFTADVDEIYGVTVVIDSLFHPSVGDLEVTITHSGTTVTLADRPVHSGENFISTGFSDLQYKLLDWDFAPYSSWYKPEDPLSVFNAQKPAGDWILSVTDHGTGGVKATDRVLEGWSLNFLTESSGGVGIPTLESMANFGLEQIRPNPLNQEAQISFRIPEPGHVKLLVYNQLGQLVARLADENLPAGLHQKTWNPGDLAAGTYFLQLESEGRMSVRKAMVTK